MTWDRTKHGRNDYDSFGFDGATVSLAGGDFTVPDTVKAIVVAKAGDIVCRPVNASADITLTGWPAGATLPWHCSAIRQTGTTATLATVIG